MSPGVRGSPSLPGAWGEESLAASARGFLGRGRAPGVGEGRAGAAGDRRACVGAAVGGERPRSWLRPLLRLPVALG